MRRGGVPDTMSNTKNKSFSLVGKHGMLQAKRVSVEFTPYLDGFVIWFSKDSEIIKDFADINEFFDYAENQKSILHFRTNIYNLDISAEVIPDGTKGYYHVAFALKTVENEKA